MKIYSYSIKKTKYLNDTQGYQYTIYRSGKIMHVSPVFPVESVAIANAQENMIRMTDDETIQKIIVE